MNVACDIPVSVLKGVGPRTLENLVRINIHTIQDLLFHLPTRYEDRTRITPIANLRPGDRVLIQGTILSTKTTYGRRASLVTQLQDATGSIQLRFFHFTASQRDRLMQTGTPLHCFGEVRFNYRGGLEIVHPEYRQLQEEDSLPLSDHLTAVYPTTKGLHQVMFRKLIDQALSITREEESLEELLPLEIRQSFKMPSLYDALYYVHRPPPDAKLSQLEAGQHPLQQRLAFEELLAHHLSLRQMRNQVKQQAAPGLPASQILQKKILQSLPFKLTAAQQRVLGEIQTDLVQAHPMLRLLQGDVGCGKTIVAAMSVCQAVEAGYQAAVMAPTELLAEQHWQHFSRWFEPLGVRVGWLSGQLSGPARRPVLKDIAGGEVSVVVGTHALFQEEVVFRHLALLIVDEQHRFGVHQRLALKEKGAINGQQPHQLIMTATPIPRTLAMTAYADLDCSVIDELPPGRKPISTILISNKRRGEVIHRVQRSCENKRQAYWVCTLVEESEVLQCRAAEATAAELQQLLPNLNVGLIHGRMKADKKETIMASFREGAIDLLVATTVVEVGVDVSNASLMIIENPERLGLAQLHQLRGRVGRGTVDSHCVLLYQSPLSETAGRRLGIMKRTQDGFKIAQEDLNMRGPGEVLGTRQAGLMQFRIADLIRDRDLLPQVKSIAEHILGKCPSLADLLIQRWIGTRERYACV